MNLEKRDIKLSSTKRFKGSAPPEFYGKGYFLNAEGSNYGRRDPATGDTIFAPYDKTYLERNRELVRQILTAIPRLNSVIVLGAARGYLVK
ncbi:MAG: hypothetical protein KAX31_05760, partial [Thermoplasmata archaeon]|nr:hypothetical protein [Thermoplasmata archaeon]